MNALQQLLRMVSSFTRAFDQQIAELPILGPLFSPKWNIIQVNLDGDFSLVSKTGSLQIPKQIKVRDIKGRNCLRLTSNNGQLRNLRLPAAAINDPNSAISLTLDTLSPFASANTAFAIQSQTDIDHNGEFTVRIAISSKSKINQLLSAADNIGLKIATIDVSSPDELFDDPVINLTTGQTAKVGFGPSKALAVICVGLLVISVALNLWTTRKLQPQLTQIDAQTQTLRFINARQQQADRLKRLSVSQTWSAVTRALPDNAWAQTFNIDNDQLRLSGQAVNAADLVKALGAVPELTQVRLAAASVQGPDGRESFDLQAKISTKRDPS